MIEHFHFLRPWWFLLWLPLLFLIWRIWRANPQMTSWQAVCDSHLMPFLVKHKGKSKRHGALSLLMTSLFFIIVSLAGPTWKRLPVPIYPQILPRVVVLDMSTAMLNSDLTPNRLTRAKFKLHDLFNQSNIGQMGLIVYTGEPFIVSPLTEDAKTIDALVETLTPDLLPVGGQRLDSALAQAKNLIKQAGFNKGQILVLTAESPSRDAINEAAKLAQEGINISLMPFMATQAINPLFTQFVKAGGGELLPFSDNSTGLEHWLNNKANNQQFQVQSHNLIPIWKDEGRWFLIPALLFLLPVFRRGWLQRIEL